MIVVLGTADLKQSGVGNRVHKVRLTLDYFMSRLQSKTSLGIHRRKHLGNHFGHATGTGTVSYQYGNVDGLESWSATVVLFEKDRGDLNSARTRPCPIKQGTAGRCISARAKQWNEE